MICINNRDTTASFIAVCVKRFNGHETKSPYVLFTIVTLLETDYSLPFDQIDGIPVAYAAISFNLSDHAASFIHEFNFIHPIFTCLNFDLLNWPVLW